MPSSDTESKSISSEENGDPELNPSHPTEAITFHLIGSKTPSSSGFWDFWDPQPARISRPINIADKEEWALFCDKVDEILDPINYSRSLAFGLAVSFAIMTVVLITGVFTFAQDLWSSRNLLLQTIVVVFGFSFLSVILLYVITYRIPKQIQQMRDQMKHLCQQEEKKRTRCIIQFKECKYKGYQIEVMPHADA